MQSQRRIIADPVELSFEEVEPGCSYSKVLSIMNNTDAPLDISLKPCPTLGRDYSIVPSSLSLRPRESSKVQVSVLTTKLGEFRDVIHLNTLTFSEKVYLNIRGYEANPSHYKTIVQDKEEQLQSSQSRIDRLEEEIEELAEKLRLANVVISEKARVEQEFAIVQQENSELRAEIQELQRSEVYNKKLKEMMKEKIPSLESLIELTLQQEKERNERKNEKILEILQIKDSLIEDLEEKCDELQNALTLMQHKLNDNKVLLNNTEKSLQSTQKTIEDLKTSGFEKDQTISLLKSKGGVVSPVISHEDPAVLKNELLKNFDHIKQLNETLLKYDQENKKLREREEYVLELSNRHSKIREDHEKSLKEKELLIIELKSKMNTQSEHIESLILKLSQMNYSEIIHKVSKLEEENKNLSRLLADSNRSSDTFKQEDLEEEEQKLQVLEAENSKLAASLREVSEQSTRLEALVSQKNKEIISLQNEIIDHKKGKAETLLKAAPSPAEEITKLSSSLREEQIKAMRLAEEKARLESVVKTLEDSNHLLNSDISMLFDNLEGSEASGASIQNQLISKISNKIQNLRKNEHEALKAAAIAEEGLRILQSELAQEHSNETAKDLKRITSDMQQIRLKYELLIASNNKLKEEIENKKQIITDVQTLMASPQNEEKSTGKKTKKKQPARTPNRIIKALITAKIGEADAVKKLRDLSKYDLELRENLGRKEEQVKNLEKEIKTQQRSKSIYLNSEIGNESEMVFETSLEQRITELELEIQELRENDLKSWAEYSPLSLMWKNELKKTTEDSEIVIEGLLHLIDQFAYGESINSEKSEIASLLIEKSQRILIKALLKSQKILTSSEEKQEKVFSFQPSREEDRKIWYVELLESQLEHAQMSITTLSEFSNKLNIDFAGNLNSIASLRGASIELAKFIKETSEEIELIKTLCILIRGDVEDISGKDIRSKIDGYNRRLNEEIQKAMGNKTREISELRRENEKLNQDLNEISEKCENYVGDAKNFQGHINKYKARAEKIEAENSELQKAVEALCAEIKELTTQKQQAHAKIEKLHTEMKLWQDKQIEVLTSRERTILDLQSQIVYLKEEQKMPKETEFTNKIDISSTNIEQYLQEIDHLQEILENTQKELFNVKQAASEERKSLVTRIADLEENNYYLNKTEDFKGNFTSTLKKDPDIQITAIQTLLREKIALLDEETRRRIDAENKLRNVILTECEAEQRVSRIQKDLEEKIESLEASVVQYEKELKYSLEDKDELMVKYEKITDSLKETTENLRRAEKDLLALQQEHKTESIKYTTRLQNTENSSMDLKSKVKELTESSDRIQKENQALYAHLKALEKEFEISSQKVEDMDRVNSALKSKLKEYEKTIEDLEEIRNIESNNHLTNIDGLRGELKSTYEEFEKTIEQFDGQITSLKELYQSELKQKKNPKKASEIIDYMLQISKKDSIIKSLKTELKSVKPKKLEKKPQKKQETPQKEEDNIYLQNQVYKLKAQVRNLESQLFVTKEEMDQMSQELDSRPVTEPTSKKEILDIEKRHRSDMQKLAEEVTRVREKWHSPEEWNSLILNNRELENTVKKLNDELNRKKDIVDSLKAIKDQQDYENNAIQEELEQIKDYSEKVKKLKVELNRKDKVISDMKALIESYKELERKMTEENTQNSEKLRSLRNDVARKETLIREMKNRMENSGLENMKNIAEECERLKDKIKSLKADCDRKDLQLKNAKAKLETAEIELDTARAERQNLSTDAFASLEKETKKCEKLQYQLKKSESQLNSLYEITRRIFKELSESVENLRSRAGQTIEKEYYSDCMDILNMDMKDLSEFVGHKSVGTMICRIERLLEQGENTAEVIDIFNRLLDERLELEKSTMNYRKPEGKTSDTRSKTSQGIHKTSKY